MTKPSISITSIDSDEIISCNVNSSHGSPTSNASIECYDHNLTLGDYVTIAMGYDDANAAVFRGYVKSISRSVPSETTTIELQDKFVRATEYFIAPLNPDLPLTYTNITAENLVKEVLKEAGLTTYSGDTTYFTLGVNGVPVEVKLVSASDYVRMIGDIIAWSVWYDSSDDTVYFRNRKPFPMDGTSGQPGDTGDSTTGYVLGVTDIPISYEYIVSEKELRNRVVVYGSESIFAEAYEASPFLPDGFYKTAVIAVPNLISTQEIAQDTADYNLAALNKLTYTIQASIPGRNSIIPRTCIGVTLAKLNQSNDTWYVYSVNHNYSSSGYTTDLELRK